MAAHQRHIEWATYRADEFAATRLMEFGPRHATLPSDSAAPAFPPITPDPSAAMPTTDTPLPDIPLEDSPTEPPAAAEETLPTVPAAEIPDTSFEGTLAEAAAPEAATAARTPPAPWPPAQGRPARRIAPATPAREITPRSMLYLFQGVMERAGAEIPRGNHQRAWGGRSSYVIT